jgi:uncharacterized protein DUF3667
MSTPAAPVASTLAAREPEGPPPAQAAEAAALAPAPPALVRCDNCGAAVPGRYCGNCGQRLEPPIHSLSHFMRVAAEDLTHADSRLWRTLRALLFKPGHLTAEFLAGRRARYMPPVRLYLVLSVAFFLVATAVQTHFTVLQFDDDQPLSGSKVIAGDQPRADETPAQRAERLCGNASYDGPGARLILPWVPAACRKVVADNGRELQRQFLHNIPRAMFVFLPLLAGIMMLMYWRPRRYYVEHLLLFVHNHAFVFLVAGVLLLLSKFVPRAPGLKLAIFLYFAWYMYRSMRNVYGQGRVLTVSKLVLLASFYLVFAALMLAVTSLYSAFML